jgi:hypothetical protein
MNNVHASFQIGDPVRIKRDAWTVMAGREGWIRAVDDAGDYFVRIGIADWLWFAADEVEPRNK